MMTMGLMSARWGTPAGAAGALTFVVIILGFAGMCAGVLILEDDRTQTVPVPPRRRDERGAGNGRHGSDRGLLTDVPEMAGGRRYREPDAPATTGGNSGREERDGRREALQSARVMTVAELRDFTRDLPQDTRILFPGAGAETNLAEGMNVQVKKITAGMDQELQKETGPDVQPTAPAREKGGESGCCSSGRGKKRMTRMQKETVEREPARRRPTAPRTGPAGSVPYPWETG